MTIQAMAAVLGVSLEQLTGSGRTVALATLAAFYEGSQYDSLSYDWDGRLYRSGAADIAPGWYVPLDRRRPNVRAQLPRLIVKRLTDFGFGEAPEIRIPGDPEAEDFARELCREARLGARLKEARVKGGSCGTVAVSFGFVEGKPRVQVHDAAHVHVLKWADRSQHKVAEAIKCWRYERDEIRDGKSKKVRYYYVRIWTETTETVYDPIPEEVAKRGNAWIASVPSHTVEHDYGECPLIWVTNTAESLNEDGRSDYAGLDGNATRIDHALSATTKGTISNVDPTLVIHDSPANNPGVVRKGSENAIFAEKGASYLELRGDAVNTALALTKELRQQALDLAGVVLPDQSEQAGAARSAAALRILYAPMIATCNDLREQYGQALVVPLVRAMLRASRRIMGREPGEVVTTEDGRRVQMRPTVDLDPKIETVEVDTPEGDEERTIEIPRSPGKSSRVELTWPPYFKPTPADRKAEVDVAAAARGTLVSDRTAVAAVAPLFGVTDVDEELDALEEDTERRAERAPPMPGFSMPGADTEDDEE